MDSSSITQHITHAFADIHPVSAWGETSFFYNPGRKLPRGIYFATLKDKDGDNDRASNLQRSDVFRLNIGISKLTYRSLFGPQPARPAAGGVVDTGHDFTVLDQLLPHPVYGWMSWVSVLNPRRITIQRSFLAVTFATSRPSVPGRARARRENTTLDRHFPTGSPFPYAGSPFPLDRHFLGDGAWPGAMEGQRRR